jgi:hypothetical protein
MSEKVAFVYYHGQDLGADNFPTLEFNYELAANFREPIATIRKAQWPVLKQALQLCQLQQAKLMIGYLGNLSSNQGFVENILKSGVDFYCCDQPFVDKNSLEILYKHSQIQRRFHGTLIRRGLEKTLARSGNPNAAEVIKQVNKPRIDSAIIFALILQPIISSYKERGCSQRQMVKLLNEEGFTAPEGGKWVLSQLQKVLERIKLNELTLEYRHLIAPWFAEKLDNQTIADKLNAYHITQLRKPIWNAQQIARVKTRFEQIEEIEHVNNFILNLLPILQEIKTLDTATIKGLFLQHNFATNMT